ncbi:MAG: hypothetical protein FD147_2073 [Chloroflexi bacterium]|nr:MAG: hypothetical protein FD147_2073 [Chloroflexota bacterium]MBA4374544.1 hypothetical protein [Anaerolinea sp.]
MTDIPVPQASLAPQDQTPEEFFGKSAAQLKNMGLARLLEPETSPDPDFKFDALSPADYSEFTRWPDSNPPAVNQPVPLLVPQPNPYGDLRGKSKIGRYMNSTIVNVEPPSTKRKRGGQPGNINALKHGVYLDGFRLRNTNPIERAQLFDINECITSVKSYIKFTFEAGIQSKNMGEINDTMRSLSLAAMGLSRLINTHNEYITSPLPGDFKSRKNSGGLDVVNYYKKKPLQPHRPQRT